VADRFRESLVLFLVLVLPLAWFTPFDDCFPLTKWLLLIGATLLLAAASAGTVAPAWRWTAGWGAWLAVEISRSPVPIWRSAPDAALLWAPVMAAGMAAKPIRLSRALCAAALVMAVHGLTQAAGWDDGRWLSPFQKGVASTIGNPDLLGGFLILPCSITLALALANPGWRTAAPPVLLGAALLATEARAAWLGLAAAGVLVVAPHRRRAATAMVAAVVVAGGWLAVTPGALARAASSGALTERLWTWRLAVYAVREAPVAGYGPGSFRSVFLARQTATRQAGATFFHYTEFAHLEPLHLWVETGAVGLGLFAWGLACALAGWWRGPLRARDPALWRGIGAGTVGLLVNAGLSFPLHVAPTATAAWLLLGAAGAPARGRVPGRFHGAKPWMRLAVVAVLLAVPFRLAFQNVALRSGQVLLLAGRPDLASAQFAEGARMMDADPRLTWSAATAARLRGDPAGALRLIDAALRLEPDFFELHHERGMTLKALGRTAEAAGAYGAAVRINPGFASAWNNLGNLLGAAGRLAEAEAAQRRALALDPGSREARQNLALTLMQEGRRREAAELLRPGLAPARRGL